MAEHSEPTEASPHPDDFDELGIDDADDLDGGDPGAGPGGRWDAGGRAGRGIRDVNGMDEPDLDEEELW